MENLKKKVSIKGWIIGIKKLGKIMFIIVQQSESTTIQAVVKDFEKIKELSKILNSGDLIEITGYRIKKVEKENKFFESGKDEVFLENLKILNKSSKLPFEIKDNIEIKEENRYKYRYLDLRRKKSNFPILFKGKLLHHLRNFLDSKNFIEIDTPILSQFSPEGAKTFTVPSNIKDKFYTLPQSPQIFKQMLMMSGFSKYYQVAKNFRNEDARSNRQPEFLQLDIECWFAEEKKMFLMTKKMLESFLTKEMKINKSNIEFKKISYEKCIETYGSDKPDLRNPLFIERNKENKFFGKFVFIKSEYLEKRDVSEYFQKIKELSEKNKKIETFILEKNNKKSSLNVLETFNKNDKHENLSKKESDFLFLSKNNDENGIYVFSRNKELKKLNIFLGKIRSLFNDIFENTKVFKFLWIKDWPLFEKVESKSKKYQSFRHPFTEPKKKYIKTIFEKDVKKIEKIKCNAYDVVCNGEEIASGSLRIYDSKLQKKIFEIIGFSNDEIENYFGYFLEALSFAAPPHGGIGIGIERMIAVFLNLKSLKETIAFPKNIDGSCSLTGTPDKI